MSKSARENRKVQRVELKQPLRVKLRSIGSQMSYELATRNISYTGFFLEFASPGRFPFTRSSIMEVWLEVGSNETVFFNGKMARVVNKGEEGSSRPGIAIRIVQIDKDNEDKLRQFIDEKSAELGVNSKDVA